MKISIIVPAFNEEQFLGKTLAQIKAAAIALANIGWETELIVCDNNSTDRTAEIARAAGANVVFEPVNQISRARNSGAAAATGDWLVFVDADSHPSAEVFADMAREIQSGNCIAGGATIRWDQKLFIIELLTPLVNLGLAAIPAATVLPLSKNLGFVAVGAYGLIASFISGLAGRPRNLPERLRYQIPAWTVCVLLLLAHVPGAIAGRILTAGALNSVFKRLPYFLNVGQSPDVEDKNIVVLNDPCALTLAYMPFYKAYHHLPLPRSARTLVPGGADFDVRRTDDKTLVIQSRAPNIFSWNGLGPLHHFYAISAGTTAIGVPQCKRCSLDGLTVEVLESDASGLASRVAFRFVKPLESADFLWLQWDWSSGAFKPFQPPVVGQSVTISGPSLITDAGPKKYQSQ